MEDKASVGGCNQIQEVSWNVMGSAEHRRSERIMVSLPVLVVGIDSAGEEFAEEARTVVVNRQGALILLKHALVAENTIRIFQLQSDAAADFRVVGPTRLSTNEGTEWGVEYLKEGTDIWGVEFAPQPPASEAKNASALLECQTCQKKYFWPLTLAEVEVLDSTGVIHNFCTQCSRPTAWIYADVARRPAQLSVSTIATPPPQPNLDHERREGKRLLIKLPILVKNQKGEAEIARTENFSRSDLAVALALSLGVGDSVTVVCPFTSSGRNLERNAKVLRSDSVSAKGRKLYGIRFAPVSA